MRLAVLASGSGTILEAMLRRRHPRVDLVLVDRDCAAASIAADRGIPVARVLRRSFGAKFDRHQYTTAVVAALRSYDIQLVAMAGYMTVLSEEMFDAFSDRVINTHPSLLPDFPGAHAVEDALAAGVKVSGCTFHSATPKVDEGPILFQIEVPVLGGDSAESLHERIKKRERIYFPKMLDEVIAELEGGRRRLLWRGLRPPEIRWARERTRRSTVDRLRSLSSCSECAPPSECESTVRPFTNSPPLCATPHPARRMLSLLQRESSAP